MKITRRTRQRIELIVSTRKAEREATKPKINYDKLFSFIPTGSTV